VSRINRVRSDPHEPSVSDRQRELLFDLVKQKVQDVHGLTDYDPVVAMAIIGTDVQVDVTTRLQAHGRVAKFVHPELKQVEVTGAGGGPLAVKHGVVEEVLDLMETLARGKEITKT
jgi:hypothetical protein